MTNVYVLMTGCEEEQDVVFGVFSSIARAQEAFDKERRSQIIANTDALGQCDPEITEPTPLLGDTKVDWGGCTWWLQPWGVDKQCDLSQPLTPIQRNEVKTFIRENPGKDISAMNLIRKMMPSLGMKEALDYLRRLQTDGLG